MTDQAIETLKQAIVISPYSAMAHYNLGSIYAVIGNYTEARKEFLKVMEIEPGNSNARQMLDKLSSR